MTHISIESAEERRKEKQRDERTDPQAERANVRMGKKKEEALLFYIYCAQSSSHFFLLLASYVSKHAPMARVEYKTNKADGKLMVRSRSTRIGCLREGVCAIGVRPVTQPVFLPCAVLIGTG